MSNVIETPDLERLARFPGRAQLAFIARCALRVLPAFIPAGTIEPPRRAAALRAANACCLTAIHASIEGSDRYRHAVARAVAFLTEFREHTSATKECVIAAGRAANATDPGELSRLVHAAFGAYRDAASEHDVYEVFLMAAGQDLADIERPLLSKAPETDENIALELIARPLFNPSTTIPELWRPRVDEWERHLKTLRIDAVAKLYAGMCHGQSVPMEEVARVADDWVRADPGAEDEHAPHVREAPSPPAEADASPVVPPGPPGAPAQSAAAPSAAPASTRPPDVWMLADRPLTDRFKEQDRFEFTDYADALAAVLDHQKTDTPFTMAINAPWGAGKTTLANMIAAQLRQRPRDRGDAPHIICWFNAWMHDDAPNLATAFISEVSRTADRHRRPVLRLLYPLPSAVLDATGRRRRRFGMAGIIFAVTAFGSMWLGEHLLHVQARSSYDAARLVTYQMTQTITRDPAGTATARSESETVPRSRPADPAPDAPAGPDGPDGVLAWVQSRSLVLGAFVTALAGLAGLVGLLSKVASSTSLAGFIQAPDKAAETGAIQAAQQQLARLIRQATWRGNRFVVFVDDIERCKPPRSIDVLDAVNQLVDHEGVIVVLLGDMSAVAAAAQLKYKDLAQILAPSTGVASAGTDRSNEAFGRLYLQKIVQFQFDLPIPPRSRIQDYMGQLAVTREPDGGGSVQSAT